MFVCCDTPSISWDFQYSGLTVQFADSVEMAEYRRFDFGDGTVDSTANPSHTYAAPGVYTVCLIAENRCSRDTLCQVIDLCRFAEFTGDTALCLGDSITFQNLTPQAGTFHWYDDGVLFSTDSNATWTPTTAGTHTVMLVANNGFCNDTATLAADVFNAPPVPQFAFAQNNINLDFFDLSTNATSWYWDFGDGNTDSVQNPSHSYAGSGSYQICLTAGNQCATAMICDSFHCTVVEPGFSYSICNAHIH